MCLVLAMPLSSQPKTCLLLLTTVSSFTKAIETVATQLGLKVNFSINKTNTQTNEYIVLDRKHLAKT
jgi:hypothetical protein